MNSAHNDQRDHAANFGETGHLSLETYQINQDMPAANITFHVGNPAREIMRISPGPPPKITVTEGVEISETAKAVLECIEHMLFQARWNRKEMDNETNAS